jgi:hypothetical protein
VLYILYDTYREICVALGFMDDDNEWDLEMTDSVAYIMPSHMRASFVIMLVFNKVGHPAGLFDKHWREMGKYFVHRLSSEEQPLSYEHLMVLVFLDINMRLETRNTNVKGFNLPVPSEEDTREVEEVDKKERIRRMPTVRRLSLYGDLEHSRPCVDKSIN